METSAAFSLATSLVAHIARIPTTQLRRPMTKLSSRNKAFGSCLHVTALSKRDSGRHQALQGFAEGVQAGHNFTGAVFEGKFYAPEDFKELESMPTRAELFSRLLGGLQGPATNLVGTLQGPARELVFTLKAYVAKLEEEAGQAPQ
ncbi:unnamed protein product [Calypogeia fissa]